MSIDKDRPVFLRQMVVDGKTGNVYFPYPNTAYLPGTLPEKFLTDEYCIQAEGAKEVVAKPVEPVKEIRLAPPEEKTKELRANFIEERDLRQPPPNLPKVNINSAIAQEIQDTLDGVGKKIAEKIVAEREMKQFTSVDDLNNRIALGFGRKWDAFSSQLEF